MHEYLFASIVRYDEPESLGRVEPLHLRSRGAQRRFRSVPAPRRSPAIASAFAFSESTTPPLRPSHRRATRRRAIARAVKSSALAVARPSRVRPSSSVVVRPRARPPSRIINVNRAIARVSRRRLARPASSASTTTRIIFIRIVRARRARTFPRWRVAIARDGASARGAIATSGRARPVPRAFRCACRRFLGISGRKVRAFCRIVRWYCVRSVGRSE